MGGDHNIIVLNHNHHHFWLTFYCIHLKRASAIELATPPRLSMASPIPDIMLEPETTEVTCENVDVAPAPMSPTIGAACPYAEDAPVARPSPISPAPAAIPDPTSPTTGAACPHAADAPVAMPDPTSPTTGAAAPYAAPPASIAPRPTSVNTGAAAPCAAPAPPM